ncbi:MAG TPA: hypothetical protein PK821_07945 [Victivallales bacterium]|nr:hypothetical protein [Victivallales bacterium]
MNKVLLEVSFGFAIVFSLINNLNALILPDGTDAVVKEFKSDKEGKIYEAKLVKPIDLDTPLGKMTFKETVTFHQNGKIKSGTFSKARTITTPAGSFKLESIRFHESGKIRECHLSSSIELETNLGKLKIRSISFYESEKIDLYTFAQPQLVATPVGELKLLNLSLHESEKIKDCSLSKFQEFDTPIGKLKFRIISFSENGKISGGKLSEPRAIVSPEGELTIDGFILNENDKIHICYLAKTTIIQDDQYYKGDIVGFDEDDKFLGKMKQDEKSGKWLKN